MIKVIPKQTVVKFHSSQIRTIHQAWSKTHAVHGRHQARLTNIAPPCGFCRPTAGPISCNPCVRCRRLRTSPIYSPARKVLYTAASGAAIKVSRCDRTGHRKALERPDGGRWVEERTLNCYPQRAEEDPRVDTLDGLRKILSDR